MLEADHGRSGNGGGPARYRRARHGARGGMKGVGFRPGVQAARARNGTAQGLAPRRAARRRAREEPYCTGPAWQCRCRAGAAVWMRASARRALRRRRWQRPAPARVRLRARAGFPPANRRPPRRPGRWPGHRARPATACARRRSPGAGRIGRVGGGDLARMNQRLAVEALVAALLAGQRQARVIVQVQVHAIQRRQSVGAGGHDGQRTRQQRFLAARRVARMQILDQVRRARPGPPAGDGRRWRPDAESPTAFRTWPTREGRRARRPRPMPAPARPAGPGFRPWAAARRRRRRRRARASSSPHGVSSALMRATHSRRP